MNYLFQFILGGGVVVGMSYLATHIDPKYSAILYGIPIQFLIAIIFINLGAKEGLILELTKQSIFYTLILISFLVLFYFLSKNFEFWTSIIIGLAYLIILNIIIFNFSS